MNYIKKTIIALFILIFLGVSFLGVFFYTGFYIPKSDSEEKIFFSISSGEGMSGIAKRLEKKGIIRKDYFFTLYGAITEKGKKIMPGGYVFSPSMSVSSIMKDISSLEDKRITIVEGWNLNDIAGFLEENGYGSKEEFFEIAGKPPFYDGENVVEQFHGKKDWEIDVLKEKPKDVNLEGYLFPDTYFISPKAPMEEVVRFFLLRFEEKVFNEIKEEIGEKEMSLFEVITIASLIEKEVITYEDKRIVSGIIQKRKEKGMRLQIDATISYLTQRRSVRIPISETRINSPYNTYFQEGLPPGPICNPSIESIRAAINPKKTEYLYYLSKPTGETVFSRTHKEHIEARNKYLR